MMVLTHLPRHPCSWIALMRSSLRFHYNDHSGIWMMLDAGHIPEGRPDGEARCRTMQVHSAPCCTSGDHILQGPLRPDTDSETRTHNWKYAEKHVLGWVIDLSTYRLTTKEARSNNHEEEGRQIGLMPLSGQLQFLFYNVHTLRKQTLSTSTCASIPSSSLRGSPKTKAASALAFFRCGNKQ